MRACVCVRVCVCVWFYSAMVSAASVAPCSIICSAAVSSLLGASAAAAGALRILSACSESIICHNTVRSKKEEANEEGRVCVSSRGEVIRHLGGSRTYCLLS
jgi:hypothetical protein